MSTSEQEVPISDYDAEWDREDAPNDQGVATEGLQETPTEETATPEGAPEDKTDETPNEDNGTPAEESSGDDEGTDADDPTEALRQAQTRIMALEGQLKASNDRLSLRGRKLKELEATAAELQKAARQPTQFEKDFPQYAEDLKTLTGQQDNEPETQTDPVDQEAETIEKILAAHPDVGQLYEDPALQTYLSQDPMFVLDGKPAFVNSALHSEDADEVIAALNHYKSLQPPPQQDAPAPKEDPLKDMVPPDTSTARDSVPASTQMTPEEQYNAEWARDDD